MSVKVFKQLGGNFEGGWSTRYIHTKRKLPMHVNYFSIPYSKKKYRICKKINGKTETFGYFNRVYEAEMFLELLDLGNVA